MSKKKLLVWSDSVVAGTGFGVVSKHVLRSLQGSGMFDIDHLAINHDGKFMDQEKTPYQVVPARLNNPKDPYGNQMFIEAFASGRYDYIWIMNDTFVVEQVARKLPSVIQQMKTANRKVPKIVYYFPVDCQVLPSATTMIKLADIPVAYCEYGKEKALLTIPEISDRLEIVNHGVDLKDFRPLAAHERAAVRAKFLNITDPDTFVWMQVNRNSPRKDIPRTILAFKEFKEKVHDKSMLYLHTAAKDTTIDLLEAVRDLGLDPTKDVIFPKNYSAGKPFPVPILNMLYNCGDAFLTTTIGEGWGLTHLEAAATKIPLVCPANTCFPEQLDNGDRGYLYDCKEKIWIDNSGYRPWALLDDIVGQMEACFNEVRSGESVQKVEKCFDYVKSIQWNIIGDQWVDIFKKLETMAPPPPAKRTLGETL